MSAAAESSQSGSDSSDQDDGSSHTASAAGENFLDLEASESGDDSSDEGVTDDDETSDLYSGRTFHCFPDLPPELRRLVWEFYCPELTAKSRLIHVQVGEASETVKMQHGRHVQTLRDHFLLSHATQAMRRLFEVNRESRSMLVRAAPDFLQFDIGWEGVVRFNKDKDVVVLTGMTGISPSSAYHLPECGDKVIQLALQLDYHEMSLTTIQDHLDVIPQVFPNLKRLFLIIDAKDVERKLEKIRWCASDYAYRNIVETRETSSTIGEDTTTLYCWPNADDHPHFAKYHVPVLNSHYHADDSDEFQAKGIQTLPMIMFEAYEIIDFESMPLYKRVKQLWSIPHEDHDESSSSDESTSESDDSDEVDEYESEGIDDSEIIIVSEQSDDDDDLLDVDQASGGSDAEASAASEVVGHFSSPEPETDDNQMQDEAANGRRAPKRPMVVDSEDEEEGGADAEPQAKRARTTRVMDSSDEEAPEVDVPAGPAGRRARVVLSDSESSEPEEMVKTNRVPRRGIPEDSEDSGESSEEKDVEDEEESSEEEDDEAPPRQSLAERLQLHRRANPIPSDEEEEESDEEDEEAATHMTLAERLQLHRRANPVSDEEDSGSGDVDDDEEDEDEMEDGMFDTMAAESDEE